MPGGIENQNIRLQPAVGTRELPVGKSEAGDEAFGSVDRGRKNLETIVPDSDAVSPFSSQVQSQHLVEGGHLLGGEMNASGNVDGAEGAAVAGVEAENLGFDRGCSGEEIDVGGVKNGTSGGAPPRGRSKIRDSEDLDSLPVQEFGDVQANLVDSPGTTAQSGRPLCIPEAALLRNSSPGGNGSAQLLASLEKSPETEAVPFLSFDILQISRDEGWSSEETIEDAANHELPPSDDADISAIEEELPAEKAYFLQRALAADEALSLQEGSTSQENPLTDHDTIIKEVLRTEIPASDEEDTTDENADPTATVYEFHTSHISASEEPDALFMVYQGIKGTDNSTSILSSTAEEEPSMTEAPSLFSEAMGMEVTDGAAPTLDAAKPVTEIRATAALPESIGVDLPDVRSEEGFFSSLVEFPPSSVNLQDDDSTTAEPVRVEILDVCLSEIDSEKSMDASASPIKLPVGSASMIPPAEHSEAKIACTESSGNEALKTVNPFITSKEPACSIKETQDLTASSFQKEAGDAQVGELSSSTPKHEESGATIAKHTTASSASSAALIKTQDEGGNATELKTLGTPKLFSTVAGKSDDQEKGQRTPKTMAHAEKSLQPTGDELPKKDILFEELKAMKIVCLHLPSIDLFCRVEVFPFSIYTSLTFQASIQARNISLEAEIAAKRAKLEEVTQELQ
jgi:hypothetical protein